MTGDDSGDRRAALGWLIGGGVVATAALTGAQTAAAADELKFDKLPKVVKDAAQRILPKATWLSAVKVEDGGKTAYEVDGEDGKDRDVTLMITADGKVVECEIELKMAKNVPAKVLKAVTDRWPRFEPTETHVIRQGDNLKSLMDGERVYDMRGTLPKGKAKAKGKGKDKDNDREIQVQVSEDGKILESIVELPDDDKVPNEVLAALKKARPKFEYGTIYVLREEGKLIGYHFEGKGPGGRDRTISVTPDGKHVEVVE
jgi:hypothetical protein